jgi:hypothetical protein
MWIKFGIEDYHIMKLSRFDFAEIGAPRVAFYLGVKGKAISLQAWTGPEGSRKSRFPHFKTIGT